MNRRLHRILGLALTLPFFAWCLTGIFFHLKPGYRDAYAMPRLKTYPLEQPPTAAFNPAWHKVQWLRTCLGLHLLVEINGETRHLNGKTGAIWVADAEQVRALVADAVGDDPLYGEIVDVTENRVQTASGREIRLNWEQLSLSQKGRDTRFINLMYEIHYLRWTGWRPLDRVLAPAGLVLVMVLLVSGLRLYWLGRRRV